jgi:hypothetical protein
MDIQSSLCFVDLEEHDQPKWVVSKDGKYSSAATWDALREKHDLVDWFQLVWFPLVIPKHSFLSWLVIKNALVTGERMLHWGFIGDTDCVFCRNGVEDRNHIFFQCGFSKRVWRASMEKCNIADPMFFGMKFLLWGCRNGRRRLCLLLSID